MLVVAALPLLPHLHPGLNPLLMHFQVAPAGQNRLTPSMSSGDTAASGGAPSDCGISHTADSFWLDRGVKPFVRILRACPGKPQVGLTAPKGLPPAWPCAAVMEVSVWGLPADPATNVTGVFQKAAPPPPPTACGLADLRACALELGFRTRPF